MSSSTEGEKPSLMADAGVSDLVRLLLEDGRKRDDELTAERERRAEESRRHETQIKEHDLQPRGDCKHGGDVERRLAPSRPAPRESCSHRLRKYRSIHNYVRETHDRVWSWRGPLGHQIGSAAYRASTRSLCCHDPRLGEGLQGSQASHSPLL